MICRSFPPHTYGKLSADALAEGVEVEGKDLGEPRVYCVEYGDGVFYAAH